MKLVPKYQEGRTLSKKKNKFARLDTYSPLHEYFLIGHSTLKAISDSLRSPTIDKGFNHKGYNIITNNCSDATRCALEKIFDKKMSSSLITTPSKVQDFAANELKAIPAYKQDSVFSLKQNKFIYKKRIPKKDKQSTYYIPLNDSQYKNLYDYINRGNRSNEF